MKCKVCGYEFPSDRQFCPLCGTRSGEADISWNTYDFPKPKQFKDISMHWPDYDTMAVDKTRLEEPVDFSALNSSAPSVTRDRSAGTDDMSWDPENANNAVARSESTKRSFAQLKLESERLAAEAARARAQADGSAAETAADMDDQRSAAMQQDEAAGEETFRPAVQQAEESIESSSAEVIAEAVGSTEAFDAVETEDSSMPNWHMPEYYREDPKFYTLGLGPELTERVEAAEAAKKDAELRAAMENSQAEEALRAEAAARIEAQRRAAEAAARAEAERLLAESAARNAAARAAAEEEAAKRAAEIEAVRRAAEASKNEAQRLTAEAQTEAAQSFDLADLDSSLNEALVAEDSDIPADMDWLKSQFSYNGLGEYIKQAQELEGTEPSVGHSPESPVQAAEPDAESAVSGQTGNAAPEEAAANDELSALINTMPFIGLPAAASTLSGTGNVGAGNTTEYKEAAIRDALNRFRQEKLSEENGTSEPLQSEPDEAEDELMFKAHPAGEQAAEPEETAAPAGFESEESNEPAAYEPASAESEETAAPADFESEESNAPEAYEPASAESEETAAPADFESEESNAPEAYEPASAEPEETAAPASFESEESNAPAAYEPVSAEPEETAAPASFESEESNAPAAYEPVSAESEETPAPVNKTEMPGASEYYSFASGKSGAGEAAAASFAPASFKPEEAPAPVDKTGIPGASEYYSFASGKSGAGEAAAASFAPISFKPEEDPAPAAEEPEAEEPEAGDSGSFTVEELLSEAEADEKKTPADGERRPEQFFTFYKKNEEFQALLDKEYERMRKMQAGLPNFEDTKNYTPVSAKTQPAEQEEEAAEAEPAEQPRIEDPAEEKSTAEAEKIVAAAAAAAAAASAAVSAAKASNSSAVVVEPEDSPFAEVRTSLGSQAFTRNTVEMKIAEMKAKEAAAEKHRSDRRRRLEEMARAREAYFGSQSDDSSDWKSANGNDASQAVEKMDVVEFFKRERAAEEARQAQQRKAEEAIRAAGSQRQSQYLARQEEARRLIQEEEERLARQKLEEERRAAEAQRLAQLQREEEERQALLLARQEEARRFALEEEQRIARQKLEEERRAAEAQRLAQLQREEEERQALLLAQQEEEARRLAQEEEQRLAQQRLEEERLAQQRLEEERRAAEAQRLAQLQREEEERQAQLLAQQEEEARRLAQEEEQRLAQQRLEEERLAQQRLEEERRAAEAQRLAQLQREEEERQAQLLAQQEEEARRLAQEEEEAKRIAKQNLEDELRKAAAAAAAAAAALKLKQQAEETERVQRAAMEAGQTAVIYDRESANQGPAPVLEQPGDIEIVDISDIFDEDPQTSEESAEEAETLAEDRADDGEEEMDLIKAFERQQASTDTKEVKTQKGLFKKKSGQSGDKKAKSAEKKRRRRKRTSPVAGFLIALLVILGLFEAVCAAAGKFAPEAEFTHTITQFNQALTDAASEGAAWIKNQAEGFMSRFSGEAAPISDVPEDGVDLNAIAEEYGKNIKSISRSSQLAYEPGQSYPVDGLADMPVCEDAQLKTSIYTTMIGYNSTWIDYVNNADDSCLKYLKADRGAYRSAVAYEKIGQVEQRFKTLELGEIRLFDGGAYIFVREAISIKENGKTGAGNSKYLYKLEKVGDEYKIAEYVEIQ